MRINGVDPKTLPTEEVLVLPRGDQRIVFKAVGIPSMEAFAKICPEPIAPGKLTKDGYVPDAEEPGYKSIVEQYGKQRLGYMVVNSLLPSQIEWDTVKIEDPSTWTCWEADLKSAGLSQIECNRVLGLVFEANCLDEAKLRKAREVFLLGIPKALAT